MKIKRKGRTYDDTPTPQVLDGEGQRDNYRINRVGIFITGCPNGADWEYFTSSRKLMDRLAAHYGSEKALCSFWIDKEPAPQLSVEALNLFLHAGHGLKYFRRNRVTWHSRHDLCSLLLQVGFPPEYVARLQPPNQVPAGLKDSHRAASHCGAS